MKIRNGFVSNSSSSSFMIPRIFVSRYQLEQIENHIEVAESLDMYPDISDAWHIDSDDYKVEGWTSMDNFDMHKFLNLIGVPAEAVKWEYE